MTRVRTIPENRALGITVCLAGIIGFFVCMSYFGLFNSYIQADPIYLLKTAISFGFLVLGFYGVGYMIGGNGIGLRFAEWVGLLFVAAYIIGFLGHVYTPFLQPYFPAILYAIFLFFLGFFPDHNWKRGLRNAAIIFVLFALIVLMRVYKI